MELTYDGDTNTLRLTPATSVAPRASTAQSNGILDIGEGGRLIGVEFKANPTSLRIWQGDPSSQRYVTLDESGRAYIQITDGDDTNARSMPIRLTAEYNIDHELIAVIIPRRGDGYEITYPSGNQ
jgi:hypothetical protein